MEVDFDDEDVIAEENARAKAIDEAERIRENLIADRRKLLTHLTGQSKPTKLAIAKLRDVQDAIVLLNDVIDAETQNT